MPIPTANYLSELDPNRPFGNEDIREGDDWIRLLVSVLQATFPTASEALSVRSWAAKDASGPTKSMDYVVLAADDGKTISVDASGGPVTITLPAAASVASFYGRIVKVDNTSNAVTIAGTVSGVVNHTLLKQWEYVPVYSTGAAWVATSAFFSNLRGAAQKLLGYDAAGTLTEHSRKYVGEVWAWPGQQADCPPGNIVLAGQSLLVASFPELFNIYGYTKGGSGANFNLPNPGGRLLMFAGQGSTAEGGGLGTVRAVGDEGGAEEHTQQSDEVGNHPHIMALNASASSEANAPTDRLVRVGSIGSDEKYRLAKNGTGAAGQNVGMTSDPADEATGVVQTQPSAMDILNPYDVIGWPVIHTGRSDHDYLGVIV